MQPVSNGQYPARREFLKRLHNNQLSGQEGVSLFSACVIGCGLAFHPTGALDAGIDGFIELRDPETGEVKAQFIATQIKTSDGFAEDNGETFAYKGTDRDIDYWFNSNTPVVLVAVDRPQRRVYWKSVQEYFQDPERKRSKKVVFSRGQDELDATSARRLAVLVSTWARPGVVPPAMRMEEKLETNLFRASFPYRVQVATTDLSAKEISDALRQDPDRYAIDWIVHDKLLVSFRDLSEPQFRGLCDTDNVDVLTTSEWIASDGDVTRNRFIQLLGRCLGERVRERLAFDRDRKYHYFKSNPKKRGERNYTFSDAQGQGRRKVISGHGKNSAGTDVSYFRHAAFFPRFVEFGGEWYLGVVPTYHFTRDGFEEFFYASERLATIKTFETNSNVRGHLRMWRALLTEQGDMFKYEYPYLSFEAVEALEHKFGVPDDLWISREDPEMTKLRKAGQHELDL